MAFTGTTDKSNACEKTVYVMDMLSIEGICLTTSLALDALIAMEPLWKNREARAGCKWKENVTTRNVSDAHTEDALSLTLPTLHYKAFFIAYIILTNSSSTKATSLTASIKSTNHRTTRTSSSINDDNN
ncbi:unnamed protein product [Cochlearia groenlandica]